MNAQKRVLVVDDDRDFVEMNRVVLENQGFQVDAAFNGEEALQKVEESPPDVIILDVMMDTKSDGFNVTHSLRNDPSTAEIPIIMLTSVNREVPYRFDKDETWLPVDVFLEKPVPPEQLVDQVKKMLVPQTT